MTNYLHAITSLSADSIVILILVGLIFFLGIQLGRNYIASALLSLYLSAFIYSNATLTKTLTAVKGSDKLFWNHLSILLLFFVPINFVVGKIVFTDFGHGAVRYLRAMALAVGFTGLLVSIFYHVIPLEPIYNLSPFVDQFFASNLAFTIWLIVPLLILFF